MKMDLKRFILISIILLCMIGAVRAEFVGYGISRIGSNQTGQVCGSTFLTNTNCTQFTDRVFFDLGSGQDFLSSTIFFTDALINEIIGQDFSFYLRWKIVLPINTSIYDSFRIYCIQTQPNNITTPTLVFINETIPIGLAGNYSTWIYSHIVMNNGQQLRCDFTTSFIDHASLQASNPIQWDLMLPSYKTLFSEAAAQANLQLSARNEVLENQLTGIARTNADYIAGAVTDLVKMNFKIWVIMFWVLMIGSVIGVFALVIYILFWFYQFAKKKIGK